jgi:hypothetical protein
MKQLAGLQRVRYVFVYPEEHDIVLVGFAEGWKVDDRGFVVGQTSKRPVLELEDLLVALRSAVQSSPQPLTCSIDPTADGLQRLRTLASQLQAIGQKEATLSAIENQLGPQTISIGGVPGDSHFARVMVAADYRMKRIAMQIDPMPVAGLPGYLNMLAGGGRGMQNMLPRWWLTTNYEPLSRDADGLAWELRGSGVKTMSEEDKLRADGTVQRTGQTGGPTKAWADAMTKKYDDLSLRDPIFGQLRNCMDLAVVAALINKERLDQRVGLTWTSLLDNERLKLDNYGVPTSTVSIASAVHKSGGWIISASGGVAIEPWQVASQQEQTAALTPVRASAAPTDTKHWWWD